MKTALSISFIAALTFLSGCGTVFTVDFQENKTLKYRFVSTRNVEVNWGGAKKGSRGGKTSFDKSNERVEMVVAYTPIEVDPGFIQIKASCQSVKARMSKSTRKGKDPVETLAGKSFMFTIDPTGKVEDFSQLEAAIKKAGEKAFRPQSSRGRIKDPDLIADFTASQWFLWDAVSSIEEPRKGVEVGQTWNSQLSVPTSMVLREARNVTYTLNEIRETEEGRIAVIRSVYSPADQGQRSWPAPYTGKFQMAGPLGFLRMLSRGFNVIELEGKGQELFNIDAGRTDGYNQEYRVVLEAANAPLPGSKPKITIEQKLTMKLLNKPAPPPREE